MAGSESTAGEAAAAAPKGASLKGMIAQMLVLTVIAVGFGALLAVLNPPPADAPGSGGLATKAAGGAECASSTANLIDLPPIVTNIGAPADVWVRVEASIVFDAKSTPHPEILAAEIATDELAYLRTIAMTQLEGPIGLENIRQDLTDRARVRSEGKVSELVLRTLVVQ